MLTPVFKLLEDYMLLKKIPIYFTLMVLTILSAYLLMACQPPGEAMSLTCSEEFGYCIEINGYRYQEIPRITWSFYDQEGERLQEYGSIRKRNSVDGRGWKVYKYEQDISVRFLIAELEPSFGARILPSTHTKPVLLYRSDITFPPLVATTIDGFLAEIICDQKTDSNGKVRTFTQFTSETLRTDKDVIASILSVLDGTAEAAYVMASDMGFIYIFNDDLGNCASEAGMIYMFHATLENCASRHKVLRQGDKYWLQLEGDLYCPMSEAIWLACIGNQSESNF